MPTLDHDRGEERCKKCPMRSRLVPSGRTPYTLRCPVCDEFYKARWEVGVDNRRAEAKKRMDEDAVRRIDQWWKRLRGVPHTPPTPEEHNTEDEIGDYWW